MHHAIPDASSKVIEIAGPAFEALADHLDGVQCNRQGGMPWWSLSELLKEPTPEDKLAGLIATRLRTATPHPGKPSRTDDEIEVIAQIVAALRAAEPCDCTRLASVLNDQLIEWARFYNLHLDWWVPEHVFGALQMHCVEQGVRGQTDDPHQPFQVGIWTPRLYRYTAPHLPGALEPWPYQPDRETRTTFMARVEVYAERVERWDEATRHSTEARHQPDAPLHLRRLIRYHCLGQTYDRIAESEGLDPASVRKSIKLLYGDLELTTPRGPGPRRSRVGR